MTHAGGQPCRDPRGIVRWRDLDAVESAEVDAGERPEVGQRLRAGRPADLGRAVPGANAGSTKSMSKERNAGMSPTRARTRSPYCSGVSYLRRLLALNHKRHVEEVACGAHSKSAKGKAHKGRQSPGRIRDDITEEPIIG